MRTEVRVAPGWGNAISDFLRFIRARDLSPGTVYQRGYQLRVLSQAFRGRNPWSLTTDDLAGYMATLTTSASTKAAQLAAIRLFYRYGADTGKIVGPNPAATLGKIERPDGVPRPAPISAVVAAIDAAPERTRLMIYLGVYAGLRRAEIARVHKRDLIREPGGFALRVLGKGRKIRNVPISDRLAAMIIHADTDGYLFPSWHRGQRNSEGRMIEQPLRPARIGELIHDVLPPGVTPHMLRHRFATNRYATNGHDILAVQQLLGHKSVETTMIYTQLPDDALRRGMDDADALIR